MIKQIFIYSFLYLLFIGYNYYNFLNRNIYYENIKKVKDGQSLLKQIENLKLICKYFRATRRLESHFLPHVVGWVGQVASS